MAQHTEQITFTLIDGKLQNTLNELKVGDEVIRNMGGILMNLKITKITIDKIICGAWEFSKKTGEEIDEDLSFPASYIMPIL